MVVRDTAAQRTPAQRLLEDLIGQRGLLPGEYTFFFVTGEGMFLPVGDPESIEESSGYVLDRDGAVFSFWLAWDATGKRPTLGEWTQVEAQPWWETVREYRDARRRMGLLAAEPVS